MQEIIRIAIINNLQETAGHYSNKETCKVSMISWENTQIPVSANVIRLKEKSFKSHISLVITDQCIIYFYSEKITKFYSSKQTNGKNKLKYNHQ